MPSNPLLLSDTDLQPLLQDPTSMDSAIDAIEQATVRYYQGHVRERDVVDRTQTGDPANAVQIHFAADDDEICGFQLFAETPNGPALPNARFITLLDRKTRQLLALVDYWSLSPFRVGASGGLGCRYLAPAGARAAGILGSSKQARAQLQAIQRSVPTLERARVFSPTLAHRESFAREMTGWLGIPVEAVGSAREATMEADIISLANDARGPVIDLAWVKAGALVISIGGGQLPPDVMDGPRIVATTWESLATREPYASRVKGGAYSRQDVAAELGALILGEATAREDPRQTVVFELTRINLWAVTVAGWAYQWAQERGVGTRFTLSGE